MITGVKLQKRESQWEMSSWLVHRKGGHQLEEGEGVGVEEDTHLKE